MPDVEAIEYGVQNHGDHFCLYERIKSPVGPWVESECPKSGSHMVHNVLCHSNCTSLCPMVEIIDKGGSLVLKLLCGCEVREEPLVLIPS